MIIPGATCTHTFVVPFAKDIISKAIISFSQNDFVVIQRIVENEYITTEQGATQSTITITLTQQESLRLKSGVPCQIQINLISGNGSLRFPSLPIDERVGDQYFREVIT